MNRLVHNLVGARVRALPSVANPVFKTKRVVRLSTATADAGKTSAPLVPWVGSNATLISGVAGIAVVLYAVNLRLELDNAIALRKEDQKNHEQEIQRMKNNMKSAER